MNLAEREGGRVRDVGRRSHRPSTSARSHIQLFAAHVLAPTAVDMAIPFVPLFVVPYLSFFLLVLLPLFVISDRQELRDVAFGFGMIVAISSVTFLFWPTAIPFSDVHPLTRVVDGRGSGWQRLPILACVAVALLRAVCAADSCRRRSRDTVCFCGRASSWCRPCSSNAIWPSTLPAARCSDGRHTRRSSVRIGPSRPTASLWSKRSRIRRRLAREASDEFAAFTRYDGRKRAAELAVFLALAGVGFWVSIHARSVASAPMLIVGILITAVALNTFPLLMHEGMHGVLFANRRWNWIASVLLGSTFLMSFSAYRVLHLRHHRYLGDPRDPDDYHNYSRSRPMVWGLHFVRLTLGPLLYVCLIPVLALKHGSPAQRKLICIEYTLLAAIYSVLLRVFSYRDLFVVWFVPLLLMGALTAIRGFTQHGITEASDPYLASRTMLPSPIVAFFLLNENYHLEHHLFPEVPSYHLPALHGLIWPKLPRAVSGTSYLAFLAAFLRATPRMDETPIGRVTPGERAS